MAVRFKSQARRGRWRNLLPAIGIRRQARRRAGACCTGGKFVDRRGSCDLSLNVKNCLRRRRGRHWAVDHASLCFRDNIGCHPWRCCIGYPSRVLNGSWCCELPAGAEKLDESRRGDLATVPVQVNTSHGHGGRAVAHRHYTAHVRRTALVLRTPVGADGARLGRHPCSDRPLRRSSLALLQRLQELRTGRELVQCSSPQALGRCTSQRELARRRLQERELRVKQEALERCTPPLTHALRLLQALVRCIQPLALERHTLPVLVQRSSP